MSGPASPPLLAPTRLGQLAYDVTGTGPAALLWHGMFTNRRIWQRVIDPLAHLRTVITVDGPSFGGSEPLTRLSTLEECAEAALELLDQLGLDRVDWLGDGWGGHLGLVAAATEPHRIRSLVAVGAPIAAVSGKEKRFASLWLPLVGRLGFVAPARRALLRLMLSGRTRAIDPEAVRLVTEGFTRAERHGLLLAFRSFVTERAELEPYALRVQAPTMFAVGDDRAEWRPEQAELIADRMPNARVRVLHGVRSVAALEDPEALAALVREHWMAASFD